MGRIVETHFHYSFLLHCDRGIDINDYYGAGSRYATNITSSSTMKKKRFRFSMKKYQAYNIHFFMA